MPLFPKRWAGKQWGAAALLFASMALPLTGRAVSCTSQSELAPQDRDTLASAGQRIAQAVLQQDFNTLQASLLPSVAAQWEGMRGVVEGGASLVKGGQAQIRNLYLLDATSLTAPADTQFFCSNANGSLTVTFSMRGLPAGRYAIVLADAAGAQGAAQMAFIFGQDANAWKIGGIFLRPGVLDGHDGVWFWQRARELEKSNGAWAAWFSYETARYLLVPVDFLSSPNLEKLGQEQSQVKNSPAEAFPYSLPDGPRTWKIDSIHLDPALNQADLAVTYESTGVSDPAAMRTEATAVLGALLKAQPSLRSAFHGLWAYASKSGKASPVMELPMAQIP